MYKQNIATYSHKLAGDIDGYDESAYADGAKFETEAGRTFNQNWGPVSSDYKGKQYWYMSVSYTHLTLPTSDLV